MSRYYWEDEAQHAIRKDDRVEGTERGYSFRGTVTFHWHYEGCMFRVETDTGETINVVPELGDSIHLLDDQTAPTVLARAAALYQATRTQARIGVYS